MTLPWSSFLTGLDIVLEVTFATLGCDGGGCDGGGCDGGGIVCTALAACSDPTLGAV